MLLRQDDLKAQQALKRLYEKSTPTARKSGRQSKHSWGAVAKSVGFGVGYVYSVARGERHASARLLDALHIPHAVQVDLTPCAHCGQAHYKTVKRCPTLPTKTRAPRRDYRRLWGWACSMLVFINAHPNSPLA
jgi:hypothetical protein